MFLEALLVAQRHHRIHARRTSRGNVTGDERGRREQSDDRCERRRVGRRDAVRRADVRRNRGAARGDGVRRELHSGATGDTR